MKRVLPLLLASLALAPVAAMAQAKPAGPLPDWSGVWIPDRTDQDKQQMGGNIPPWNPQAARLIKQMFDDEEAGKPHNIFTNCLPEGMPTWMMISHNAMEILVTPGRVTLLGESDGDRLRRIWTDGRKHPADPDPTFHGHSIGVWEGQTLAVDTVAILPEVYIAVKEAVGVANNGDMHITERIHLSAPDVLADELTITAPHVLTTPYKTTRYFKRQRGEKADIIEGVCRQGDFAESTDKAGNAVFVPAPTP